MSEHTQPATFSWLLEQNTSTQTAILRDIDELVRIIARELIEQEVERYAGARHSRDKPHSSRYARHGSNPGSIHVGTHRLPIDVPRVRDQINGKCKTLASYKQMHKLSEPPESLLQAIALGVGTRNYHHLIETASDSFGLSKSQISAQFVERSAKAYEEFRNRPLPKLPIVAMMIDGKTFQRQQIIVALGYDQTGKPHVLDMIHSTTENSRAIADMLRGLLKRGLNTKRGLLLICDGSKGILAAAQRVLGNCLIQRCRVHKAENVASYLTRELQAKWRRKLYDAWKLNDYGKTKEKFDTFIEELEHINVSAARSLQEGLEETLTLQRIGMNELFGRYFGTTNRIENLNRTMERFTRNVCFWSQADQRLRWACLAALHHESKMKRIGNAEHLEKLTDAIIKQLRKSNRR